MQIQRIAGYAGAFGTFARRSSQVLRLGQGQPKVEAYRENGLALSVTCAKRLAQRNPKLRDFDMKSVVELQFVRELEQSGFLKSIKGN
jgi:hypothetical protein